MTGNLYGMVTVSSSSEYTQLALNSFFRHTKLTAQDRFVLIDNDGAWCQQPDQIVTRDQIHLNSLPGNFSQNINQLINMADQGDQDLMFLNNDVVFTPKWNQRMILGNSVLSVPACNQTHDRGFPQSLSIQEFGARYGKLNVAAHVHAVQVREPWESLLMPTYVCRIPRQIYRAVGLFDTAFNVGGEDVDYRLRLLIQGFTIKYCSGYLLHFNGRSSWNGVETIDQTQTRNQQYTSHFIRKWGEDLFNLCVTGGQPQLVIGKYQLQDLVVQGRFNQIILEVLKYNDVTRTNLL